jgi:hypothetical protein
MDRIDLAQDRDQWRALVNTKTNLWVPWNDRKFLSSRTIDGFSRRAQLHEVSFNSDTRCPNNSVILLECERDVLTEETKTLWVLVLFCCATSLCDLISTHQRFGEMHCLLFLVRSPKYGGHVFNRNTGMYQPDYTVLWSRKQQ